MDILGTADISNAIFQVKDIKSGSLNDILTPGKNLKISGSKIRVSGENTACGIFFVNAATQARVAVPSGDIVTNNPSEIIIVIPELAAGTYTLEIVSQYAGSNTLKEPRTSVLEKPLTVA